MRAGEEEGEYPFRREDVCTVCVYVCSKRFQRQRLTWALLRNGGNGYLDAGLKSPNILSYLDFVTTLQHVRVRVEIALLDGVQINPLEMALFPELASTYQRAYPNFTIGNETKKERRRRRRSLKKKEYASLLTRNLAGYDWFSEKRRSRKMLFASLNVDYVYTWIIRARGLINNNGGT